VQAGVLYTPPKMAENANLEAICAWIREATSSQISPKDAAAYAQLILDAGVDSVQALAAVGDDFDEKIAGNVESVIHRRLLKNAVATLSAEKKYNVEKDSAAVATAQFGSGSVVSSQDSVDALNAILQPYRVAIKPRPYADLPDRIASLLKQSSLTGEECAEFNNHFILTRTQLLEVIRSVREPNHPSDDPSRDGGSLETSFGPSAEGHEGQFPRFVYLGPEAPWTAGFLAGQAYARAHQNVADGKGVDEVMQVQKGAMTWHFMHPGQGPTVQLHVAAGAEQGWIVTYDGSVGHGAIVEEGLWSSCQVICGPSRFEFRYLDVPTPWL